MKFNYVFEQVFKLLVLTILVQLFFSSCQSNFHTSDIEISKRNLMKENSNPIQGQQALEVSTQKIKNIISNGKIVSGKIEYLGSEFDNSNISIINDTVVGYLKVSITTNYKVYQIELFANTETAILSIGNNKISTISNTMDRNTDGFEKSYKEFEKYSAFIALAMELARDVTPNKASYRINNQANKLSDDYIIGTNFSSTRSFACFGAYQDVAFRCSNQFCIGCGSWLSGNGGQNCDCACLVGDYICSCSARGKPCLN
jgi:hypothetical protein